MKTQTQINQTSLNESYTDSHTIEEYSNTTQSYTTFTLHKLLLLPLLGRFRSALAPTRVFPLPLPLLRRRHRTHVSKHMSIVAGTTEATSLHTSRNLQVLLDLNRTLGPSLVDTNTSLVWKWALFLRPHIRCALPAPKSSPSTA